MFCSTVIPTVGRPTLTRAVQSVIAHTAASDEHQIVVVNDSPRPLPPAAWQSCAQVTLLNTQQLERSAARNAGAAVARGAYLHFLDDDDWLLPDGLLALARQARSSGAAWVYGATQLVDTAGQPLVQLHHHWQGNLLTPVIAGEWIPLQSSLIQAKAFFEAGGFRPDIWAGEDVDLCRRIALRGDFAQTGALVACVRMRPTDTTTDYGRHATQSRRAREAILAEPGVFQRLRRSAPTPFWQGRIVRVYLTSVVWNLQRQRLPTAMRRTAYSLASFGFSFASWWSPSFWRALLRPYASETFGPSRA